MARAQSQLRPGVAAANSAIADHPWDNILSMPDLARIGVAIDEELLTRFDKLIAKRGYTNRSEAFRDLIRNELIQEVWQASDVEMFGYFHASRAPGPR
jgi:hypothetical protein